MSAPCPRFGFMVTVAPRSDAPKDSLVSVVQTLSAELTRAGLVPDEPTDHHALAVIREGSQTTDSDRAIAIDLAARWAGVATVTVGSLVDLSTSA